MRIEDEANVYRLQKNGVITAEHPMNKMQQEGRFEELSDSDEE